MQLLAEQACAIATAAELVLSVLRRNGKILLCGNGGSAADAQHFAAELVGRFEINRAPLPAIALTADTSIITAIANDYGFERVFSRQVEALGQAGDLLVAITTSGTSPNVLAAVAAARAKHMHVLGLTGGDGAAFLASCDAGVAVPSEVTARIQELHIATIHVVCEIVEQEITTSDAARAAVRGSAAAAPGELKLLAMADALAWREACRARRKTVVWTNGVFDLLHVGHLQLLREARRFGDVLIVGVNGDGSVTTLKGSKRPIYPCAERVALLAALTVVDAIVVFHEATPEAALARLQPDVHVKGADYLDKPLAERGVVESYGGRIEFVELVQGRSSSHTLRLIEQPAAFGHELTT